eukprot:4456283-Pleurochrysis_carterae.AAC.1
MLRQRPRRLPRQRVRKRKLAPRRQPQAPRPQHLSLPLPSQPFPVNSSSQLAPLTPDESKRFVFAP